MRLKLAAAFTAAALAGVAYAQAPAAPAAACPAFPADVTEAWPDGATARARDMQAANERYQAWATATTAALECRKNRANEIKVQLDPLLRQHEAVVAEFNAGSQKAAAVSGAWKAETDEYAARNAPRAEGKKGRN